MIEFHQIKDSKIVHFGYAVQTFLLFCDMITGFGNASYGYIFLFSVGFWTEIDLLSHIDAIRRKCVKYLQFTHR